MFGVLGCFAAHLFAIMFGALLLALPVHASRALVVHMQAIRADVALAGLGISRNYRRQRDEAPAILGPALQDGEIEERKIALLDDFLARPSLDVFWEVLADLSQHRQHFEFVEKALRRLHVHEHLDASWDFV